MNGTKIIIILSSQDVFPTIQPPPPPGMWRIDEADGCALCYTPDEIDGVPGKWTNSTEYRLISKQQKQNKQARSMLSDKIRYTISISPTLQSRYGDICTSPQITVSSNIIRPVEVQVIIFPFRFLPRSYPLLALFSTPDLSCFRSSFSRSAPRFATLMGL